MANATSIASDATEYGNTAIVLVLCECVGGRSPWKPSQVVMIGQSEMDVAFPGVIADDAEGVSLAAALAVAWRDVTRDERLHLLEGGARLSNRVDKSGILIKWMVQGLSLPHGVRRLTWMPDCCFTIEAVTTIHPYGLSM